MEWGSATQNSTPTHSPNGNHENSDGKIRIWLSLESLIWFYKGFFKKD